MELTVVVLGVVAVSAALFWGGLLLDVMRRGDEEFPGRYDKVLWVVILVFVPVVGAVVYMISRPVEDRAPEKLRREWERMERERGGI